MAITYATWNPADKAATIVLSNGNLTATNSDTNWWGVRSTISKWASSWKWYWEYIVGWWTSAEIAGVAGSSWTLSFYLGSDANGWGYQSNSWSKTHSGSTAYWTTYTTWDVIGIALDYSWTTASITFYKNNVSQWVAFSWLSWNIFAACSLLNGAASPTSFTANFGASALTYTPPAGFNAGIYTWANDTWLMEFFLWM